MLASNCGSWISPLKIRSKFHGAATFDIQPPYGKPADEVVLFQK